MTNRIPEKSRPSTDLQAAKAQTDLSQKAGGKKTEGGKKPGDARYGISGKVMAAMSNVSDKLASAKSGGVTNDFIDRLLELKDKIRPENEPNKQEGILDITARDDTKFEVVRDAAGKIIGKKKNEPNADVTGFFAGNGERPVLASDKEGRLSFLNRNPDGSFTAKHAWAGKPETLNAEQVAKKFTRLETLNGGSSKPALANQAVGGLQLGQSYTFSSFVNRDQNKGTGIVVKGKDGVALPPLTVPEFNRAFGADAMGNLLTSTRAQPFTDKNNPNQTYIRPPKDAVLFDGPPNPNGVVQGGIGDCYLQATLASMADKDPKAVAEMIRPSRDGNAHHYDVRLQRPDPADPQKSLETWVTVDDSLAANKMGDVTGSGLSKGPTGKPQIGYALIEKAYVQYNNFSDDNKTTAGIQGITGGSDTIQDFTGKPSTSVGFEPGSDKVPPEVWDKLSGANDGKVVTAASYHAPEGDAVQRNGIVAGHAYSVLGTRTDAEGNRFVTLRNPWGQTEPNGTDPALEADDGTFEISYEAYTKDFGAVISQ